MEGLGINTKLLIAQIVNFAIFYFIFKKFAAKPFMDFIKKSKEKEQEKEKILEDLKNKQEDIESREKQHQFKMKKEMQDAVKQAQQEGNKVRDELLSKTKSEIADLKAKAQTQIEDERNEMYREIKGKIVNLSTSIVNSALKDYLTEDAKKELTNHILKSSSLKELNV